MTACSVWNAANAAGGGPSWVTPTVSLSSTNVSKSTEISNCYANLQYNVSGEEFQNSAGASNNFSTSRGNWADSGDPEGAWLEYSINSGSFYTTPGSPSTRLTMESTRSFRVRDIDDGIGTQSCNFDVEMWDAASGGSSLDSVAGLVLTADKYNSCPLCCFLPETLILMADGTHKAIGDIKAGELIANQGRGEPVGEVLIRENRPMVTLTFEDGRTLILSADHPIYIKGKGMASVRPEADYKGLGLTVELKIGDYAKTESGILIKLVGIDSYDFRGKVYTFSNSLFFAGGLLVY